MKHLNYYDKLAGHDVWKIEEDIIYWAEHYPNGIMLIDESTLCNLRSKLVEEKGKTQKSVLMLEMDKISISWINIGGEKAILSIIQDNQGNLLYKQPESWKDCELWYHFK